ncbi:MAG: immunoglobulin-like domain-containing protein [Mycoplasmatales bacterium]
MNKKLLYLIPVFILSLIVIIFNNLGAKEVETFDLTLLTTGNTTDIELPKRLSGETNSRLINLFKVQAYDYQDGDISSNIQVDQSQVNFHKVGYYQIMFSVSDSDNNTTTISREIRIISRPPMIDSKSKHTIDLGTVLTDNDILSLFKVQALDPEDGFLFGVTNVEHSNVDYTKAGTYPIYLTAYDTENNHYTKTVYLTIKESIPWTDLTPSIPVVDESIPWTDLEPSTPTEPEVPTTPEVDGEEIDTDTTIPEVEETSTNSEVKDNDPAVVTTGTRTIYFLSALSIILCLGFILKIVVS